MTQGAPETIEAYIARCEDRAAVALKRIAETVRAAAPDAVESISYGVPTFRHGKVILHFGAFKDHIGVYPPVRDRELQARIAPYRDDKGHLRFPPGRPIPRDLIAEIVAGRRSSLGAR